MNLRWNYLCLVLTGILVLHANSLRADQFRDQEISTDSVRSFISAVTAGFSESEINEVLGSIEPIVSLPPEVLPCGQAKDIPNVGTLGKGEAGSESESVCVQKVKDDCRNDVLNRLKNKRGKEKMICGKCPADDKQCSSDYKVLPDEKTVKDSVEFLGPVTCDEVPDDVLNSGIPGILKWQGTTVCYVRGVKMNLKCGTCTGKEGCESR